MSARVYEQVKMRICNNNNKKKKNENINNNQSLKCVKLTFWIEIILLDTDGDERTAVLFFS